MERKMNFKEKEERLREKLKIDYNNIKEESTRDFKMKVERKKK